MTTRQLEVRNDDGSVTICELDLASTTVSEQRTVARTDVGSPLDFVVDRYEIDAVVGRGGFATVVSARDRRLQRIVALKIPRRDPEALLSEGELAARLEHPNIVPVYDVDEGETGPFYVMKLLDGASLREVLERVARGDEETRTRFSEVRLLEAFRQVCLAVQYAHDRGVLHRDIKPANIILGQYGEVVLADWGIARRVDSPEDETVLRGTLAFIAPERITESPAGTRASDVFALGAVLYQILALRPAYHAARDRILASILDGPPPPPSTVRDEVSPRMEALCLSMLSRDPTARPASASAVATEIADYLDATRNESARKRRARASFQRAREVFDAYQLAVRQMREKETIAQDHARTLSPDADRSPLWRLLAHAAESRTHREVMFGRVIGAFEQVLHDDDDHYMARAALAELHLERLVEAEQLGDRDAVARAAQFVFATGHHAAIAQVKAPARIRFVCNPPTARAELHEFRPVGPVLELVDRVEERHSGDAFEVPPGSYALLLRADDHVEQWLPFTAGRGERRTLEGRMFLKEEVPKGFVVINAASHDYAIGKHPVTVEQFLEFVNDIPLARARELLPDDAGGIGRYLEYTSHAGWGLPSADADGDSWDLRWPMLLLSRDVATELAAWASTRTGFELRLPTKEEWEWAASGPDGRPYPWGPDVDHGCANFRTNLDRRSMPMPVGSFPVDRSPFGVYDLGGGVTEWLSSTDPVSGAALLKGASFNAPPDATRIDVTRTARPHEGFSHYGMRLCCTLRSS